MTASPSRRDVSFARAAMLLAAAALTVLVAVTIARRIAYPYDLEAAEGSMLCHVLRLVEGRPLYARPSLDFVAHPYPPLYVWIVSLLARVVGVSYLLARLVSLASLAGALAVGVCFLRCEGAPLSIALASMAILVAAYVPLGAWFDLARVDCMMLLFAAAGVTLAWRCRRSRRGIVAAALLLLAGCFTKQTMLPLVLAVAVALAVVAPRRLPAFVATLAAVGVPLIFALQYTSDGWFSFYLLRMKAAQGFGWSGFFATPGRVGVLVLPASALVVWTLVADWRARTQSPTLIYVVAMAIVSVLLAAMGRATPGGYVNAHIPAVYFVALTTGLAATRTLARRPATTYWLLTATLLLAPGVIPWLGTRLFPVRGVTQAIGYDIAPFLPTAAERARGDALVTRLRAVDGDVFIPGHPYYGALAGKRTFVSEMGLTDLRWSGIDADGLDDAIAAGRFAVVVLDRPRADTPSLRRLIARYSHERELDGPRVGGERIREWRTLP